MTIKQATAKAIDLGYHTLTSDGMNLYARVFNTTVCLCYRGVWIA